MHPVLFQIGEFIFYTHGVFAAFGIIAGIAIALLLNGKRRTKVLTLDFLVIVTIIGLFGARLVYFFVYRNQFENVKEIFLLDIGSFISFGGMLFGGLGLLFLAKLKKDNIGRAFDIVTPAFFAGFFFGRIGEIFAGEYNGVFVSSSLARFYLPIDVFPTPLYEGILSFLLFVIGLIILGRKTKTGLNFAILIGLYGLGRFFIDFWRIEPAEFVGLSLGQLTSIALFIFSAILVLLGLKKESRGTI